MSFLWIMGRITLFYSPVMDFYLKMYRLQKLSSIYKTVFSSYFLLWIAVFMILFYNHYVMFKMSFFLLFVHPLKHLGCREQLCKRLSLQNNLRILHPLSQPTYSTVQFKFQIRCIFVITSLFFLFVSWFSDFCYSFSLSFQIKSNLFSCVLSCFFFSPYLTWSER